VYTLSVTLGSAQPP